MMSRGWTELLRSLGDSLVGVAGAEAEALKGDLRDSGRQVVGVVVLAAVAAFFFFWVVGALGFVLFQILSLWLPRWGAAAIVLAIFLILASILALVARQRARSIELPVDTVRRRWDDHRDWWQSQVLVEEGANRSHLPESSRQDQKGPEGEA